MRVFINDRPVDVDAGVDAAGAVLAATPELAARLAEGTAYVTDGRGIAVALDTSLAPGSILRVVLSARRPGQAADADP